MVMPAIDVDVTVGATATPEVPAEPFAIMDDGVVLDADATARGTKELGNASPIILARSSGLPVKVGVAAAAAVIGRSCGKI